MRTIAFNGLAKYPQFIRVYWSRFPDPSPYKSFNEILDDHSLFTEDFKSIGLYMPLRNLIAVTKLSGLTDPDIIKKMEIWSRDEFKNNKRFIELSALNDTNETLKSFLIRHDFLS